MIPLCRRANLLLALVLMVVAIVVGPPTPSWAHTELVTTSPAVDEVVTEPLGTVSLTFDAALLADGDHVIGVFAPDGETRVDLDDTTAIGTGQIQVSVGPVSQPGTYEVRWVILAEDGDEQRGEFTFEMAASATAPSTQPTPAATPTTSVSSPPNAAATPAATPTPAPSSGPATSDDGATPLLPIIAIVAVVAGLAAVFIRRRATT